MAYKFNHAALGGTFDFLHKGHISLLQKAFKIGQFVSIGITCDKFLKSCGKVAYENERERNANIGNFLKSNRLQKRAKIVSLNNIFGTTLVDRSLQALVVSRQTLTNAKKINSQRQERNLPKLKIIVCPQVLADDGKLISSGRIRQGEINTDGQSYLMALAKISGKRFANQTRQKLKIPFGAITKITGNIKSNQPIVTVGDITTRNFVKNQITPKIAIVDFLVNRKKRFNNLHELGFPQANPDIIVKNPPGQIAKELIDATSKAIKNQSSGQIILVAGEEDLAVIPALLLTPLGWSIYYGQPERGAVKIVVNLAIKEKVARLIL